MGNLKIIPIKVGSEMWPRSYLSGLGANDVPEEIPHIMFYIDGSDKKVLVDTGGGVPRSKSLAKFPRPTYVRKPEEEPSIALEAATGLYATDIDVVILTHLHWDHSYNCHLFPQAQFYVQISEVIASINPIPRFQKTYESFSINSVPPWARQPLKWNFINGDCEIVPGISSVLVPGHSKGIQGVLVETAKGLYFLGSDSVPLYDNVNKDGTVVPSTLSLSLENAFYSCQKINKLGATIIPGHDPLVLTHKIYPA